MIAIDEHKNLINVAVFGEFTLADFKEFEEAAVHQTQSDGPANLLFDLREMADFTLDVAWEEIKFSRQHPKDFKRIAVLTDSEWVAWSAWLSQIFVEADVEVFHDEQEARSWLAEPAE
ncbi:MAG: STAS/SEC14 domain-containing protein [Rhodocyclaceae bacterium]|jgi:hypothetical protein